jgi:acyl carrier protein
MRSNIRSTILTALVEVLTEDGIVVPTVTDETVLLQTGLDSLGFAVLVTRLEEQLGFDPFTLMKDATYPKTFIEFVSLYQLYAPE